MKKAVLAVLAVVLVLGGFFSYRIYQAKQAEARYRAFEVEMVRAEFGAYVARLQEAAGQKGRDRLKGFVDEFPHHDSGIGYAPRFAEREDGDFIVLALRVQYIYRGSAAEKAGVLPGDTVSAITGVGTEFRCAKRAETCPDDEAIKKMVAAIRETDNGPSTLYLRRADKDFGTVRVVPIAYGQDIHDYLAAHLDTYTGQLDEVAPKVAALAEKLKTLDEKSIEPLSAEARALAKEVSAPYKDVEAYMETRIILPSEPTRADPQF